MQKSFEDAMEALEKARGEKDRDPWSVETHLYTQEYFFLHTSNIMSYIYKKILFVELTCHDIRNFILDNYINDCTTFVDRPPKVILTYL